MTAGMRGEQKEEFPLLLEGEVQIVQKNASTRDRLKAAELIGKRYGLFSEKLELQGGTTVQIVDNIPEGDADD